MAQFQPKKININEINGGQKWEVGQSPSVNTFNAPIESALYSQSLATQKPNITDIDGQGNPNVSIEEINGAPRFKFSNLKGKDGKDLSKEVKELQKTQEENKKSIINLYAITSPLYVQKTIEQSYSSRITANGENIFNEQFTPILKVEGSTVKSKNLLPVSEKASQTINGVTFTNNGDGTFTLNGTATAAAIYSVGGLDTTTMPIPAGTYTLSGGISSSIWLQGKIAEAGFDSIAWYDYGKGGTYATTEHHYFRYNIRVTNGTVCNNVIVKPMLELGATKTEYQPYFTGLKNASFKGIKSTNTDGTEEDTLELPEAIDCGLGTIIDFENNKIIEKGATIIFTGAENWKSYKYTSLGIGYTSLYVDNATDEPTNARILNGVVTDGELISASYKDGGWWVGYNNRAIILGVERYFNFTQFADPNNPTTDELKNLVAEWKAYLAKRHSEGNPVAIRYVSSTVQAETPFTDAQKSVGNTYKAWNNGTETVEQGEADNSVYGASNKIEQTYFAPLGEETYE